MYQHLDTALEAVSSEYVPMNRIYILPEASQGKKVIECHMSDFEPVQAQDMSQFHLKPSSSGGHERKIAAYMEAVGTLIVNHPAAIARVENFTL
jgi:hypothetical protein